MTADYTTLIPPQSVIDQIVGPAVIRHNRVEIYNQDGTSGYDLDAALVTGTISVSNTRDERRTLQLQLYDLTGSLVHSPDQFWYDKVIKCYSGAYDAAGLLWETQVGEFVIDTITTNRFPKTVDVTGRDYTKLLKLSKFVTATNFQAGQPLESVISAIASNAGITKTLLPNTGVTLATDFLFEQDTTRLKAINDLANAYNYEVYFDPQGRMVMRTYRDPSTTPSTFTFTQGTGGTMIDWRKISSDTNIYNHIVVAGQRSDQLPIFAEALNLNGTSPSSVPRIGDRTYTIKSSFFQTVDQAQAYADSQLAILGLESFEIDMTTIVVPWLEVGDVVTIVDPNPAPGDPTQFLLTDFSLPLQLGTMAPVGKRVTIVK